MMTEFSFLGELSLKSLFIILYLTGPVQGLHTVILIYINVRFCYFCKSLHCADVKS